MKRKRRSRFRKIKRIWGEQPWVQRGRDKFKNFDEAVLLTAAGLVFGLVLGGIVGYDHARTPAPAVKQGGGFFSKITRSFSPVVAIPGRQPGGEFVFADFETVSNFSIWKADSALLQPADEHAAEGEHSGHLQFYGNTRLTGVHIEAFFNSRYAMSDWSDYSAFRVVVYNPQPERERNILQIKDRNRKVFKTGLWIEGGATEDFRIEMKDIAEEINIRNIGGFSFFLWENKIDRDFYIDHVRLE